MPGGEVDIELGLGVTCGHCSLVHSIGISTNGHLAISIDIRSQARSLCVIVGCSKQSPIVLARYILPKSNYQFLREYRHTTTKPNGKTWLKWTEIDSLATNTSFHSTPSDSVNRTANRRFLN